MKMNTTNTMNMIGIRKIRKLTNVMQRSSGNACRALLRSVFAVHIVVAYIAQIVAQMPVRALAQERVPAGVAAVQDSLARENRRARLQATVRYLASEELQGRAPGSEGNEKAVQYIAETFRLNGLQMLDTSYMQRFPMLTAVRLGANNKALVKLTVLAAASKDASKAAANKKPAMQSTGQPTNQHAVQPSAFSKAAPSKTLTWQLGKDYTPLAFSEDSAVYAPLAFVGYGISAKELGYDDYAGMDVRGKAVIVLRGIPERKPNPHSPFQKFASLRAKALTAREHGAAAVIVVNSSSESVGGERDDLPQLRLDRTGNSGIMAVQATIAAVNQILPPGMTLGNLEGSITDDTARTTSHSFTITNAMMTLSVDLEHRSTLVANVIGVVRGTDTALAGQHIIVGAHCDHLGMGEENSLYTGKEPRIHFGADDNASGTAGMLELAAMVARQPLRRSVVFIAFNGEESGLLGSQWYCKHPRLPLEQSAFMLNLDMIGRMQSNALSVHGTGTSSRWNALVDSLGKTFDLAISKSADGFGPSDHASFYANNVPVLFLFTGLHDDYHRPSDTWEKINIPGKERIVRFAESLLRSVDAQAAKPDYIKVQANQAQRAVGFRVYVGTIPDYNDHPKGMRISGVREGSPAQKAGLKEGDVLVQMGETRIKNVYDYTYALANFKPGDKATVIVLRANAGGAAEEEIRAELTFEQRK